MNPTLKSVLFGIAAAVAVFFVLPFVTGSQARAPRGYYAAGCRPCPTWGGQVIICPAFAGWFYGRGYLYRCRPFFAPRGRLELVRGYFDGRRR